MKHNIINDVRDYINRDPTVDSDIENIKVRLMELYKRVEKLEDNQK